MKNGDLSSKLAAAAGVEPATCSLGESRSIQLSYVTASSCFAEENATEKQPSGNGFLCGNKDVILYHRFRENQA